MTRSRILDVAELDFRLAPREWDFARERARDIRAFWAGAVARQPSLFNGRVLLLGDHEFQTRPDGALALGGTFFEVEYAAYLAWREFGHPGEGVCNGFSMAAMRGSDGAFLLGEMGAHTSNPGSIYFAAGTPDRQDVFGDKVDLTESVIRELAEETGILAQETEYGPGWTVVYAPPRIACMKVMTLAISASAASARIAEFLAKDPQPELARMHIARGLEDIQPSRMPSFIGDFLRHAFAQSPVG